MSFSTSGLHELVSPTSSSALLVSVPGRSVPSLLLLMVLAAGAPRSLVPSYSTGAPGASRSTPTGLVASSIVVLPLLLVVAASAVPTTAATARCEARLVASSAHGHLGERERLGDLGGVRCAWMPSSALLLGIRAPRVLPLLVVLLVLPVLGRLAVVTCNLWEVLESIKVSFFAQFRPTSSVTAAARLIPTSVPPAIPAVVPRSTAGVEVLVVVVTATTSPSSTPMHGRRHVWHVGRRLCSHQGRWVGRGAVIPAASASSPPTSEPCVVFECPMPSSREVGTWSVSVEADLRAEIPVPSFIPVRGLQHPRHLLRVG
jgi:hypothetical protein